MKARLSLNVFRLLNIIGLMLTFYILNKVIKLSLVINQALLLLR